MEAVSAADDGDPVFSGSYSGLFKTFFDILEPHAPVGCPALRGVTAGTAGHGLVLDHTVRPLFSYLEAPIVPTGLFAELVAARPTSHRPDPFGDVPDFASLLGS